MFFPGSCSYYLMKGAKYVYFLLIFPVISNDICGKYVDTVQILLGFALKLQNPAKLQFNPSLAGVRSKST